METVIKSRKLNKEIVFWTNTNTNVSVFVYCSLCSELGTFEDSKRLTNDGNITIFSRSKKIMCSPEIKEKEFNMLCRSWLSKFYKKNIEYCEKVRSGFYDKKGE